MALQIEKGPPDRDREVLYVPRREKDRLRQSMRAKRMSQVRLSVCGEAQCAHAGPVATWPTINPTAWQTAALGFEGSAALKRRQQRPITGPENGAGTGRRARLAWPGWAEELRESPPCSGRPRGRLRMCAPNGLRRSRSSKCSFGSCP